MSERSEKVSIQEASKLLGMSINTIRIMMEKNMFNPAIGYCMPSIRGDRINHYIYRNMLNNYLGIKNE